VPFTFTTALNHIFLPAGIDVLLKLYDNVLAACTVPAEINSKAAIKLQIRLFFITVCFFNEMLEDVVTDEDLDN